MIRPTIRIMMLLTLSLTAAGQARAQDASRFYRGGSLHWVANPYPKPPHMALIPEPVRVKLPGIELREWQPDGKPGRIVRLDTLAGQVTLLDVWSRTCLPCIPVHDLLMQRSEEWGAQGIRIVSVLTGEGENPVGLDEFFAAHKGRPPFPTFLDPTNQITRQMRSPGIPALLVLDHHGRVAADLGGVRQVLHLPVIFPTLQLAQGWNQASSP